LAALVFPLVAFPLAVRSHPGGRSIALAGSLVSLVSYYMLLTSLEGSALREGIPAWIAIWTPNITFAIIGLTLLVATAREWRAPRLTFAWRALDALRPPMPGTRASTGTAPVGPGATDPTHIPHRYLTPEIPPFPRLRLPA